MKFNCGLSKEHREYLRRLKQEADFEKMRQWHDVYAWWPIRVGENDCRWLETIEEKFIGDFEDFLWSFDYPRCWLYKAKS